MKADAKSFKFLSIENKVKIPFFQRTYVWKKENWEDLLNEFLNENKKSNFLGAIILKQILPRSGEPRQLEVIDGQQRLTTLCVLLKALYDSLSAEARKNSEGAIMEILKYKRDVTSPDYEWKIEHSHVDSEYYKKVMEGDIDIEQIKNNKNSHPILVCYAHFKEKLDNMGESEKIKLLNKMLNPENKMLVVIDLDENDDEQSIFDTLNTAGVRLTTAEIVKNAMFKRAIELSSKEDAITLYEMTWKKTFLEDEDTQKYWEIERPTGRLKRDNLQILLHCVGVIKRFYDPDEHTLSALSKEYKKQINSISSIGELKDFINEVIDYAKIYKEKIENFDRSDTFSFDDSIRRLFHILEELEISTFHPFILYIFKIYQNDERKIKETLRKLENFIIRNMLGRVESVKNYNKLCKQFIKNESDLDSKLNEIPWDKVRRGLQNISNRDAALLLFWIELYRRSKEKKHDELELKYDFTLEHIMPIKWEEHWNFDKVPHPNKSFSLEEQKQDRNEKVRWLGNMTLLKSRLNTALSNQDFESKMKGEGRKKGIIAYSSLSITKDDIVEPFNNGDRIWNEDKIRIRTEKLEGYIKRIWG